MKARILFLVTCFILLLGSASAVYELCDSVNRGSDANNVTFTCNITTSKIAFTQQDIDGFWEKILKEEDYIHDRLKIVEWKIQSSVIQVSDDLRFIEPLGMDIEWDLTLTGDSNTFHDFNQALANPLRSSSQTAIKQRIGGLQNYFISIAPLGERKSVRNITLERPSDSFAVYISGSPVKEMEIDIEGTLSLTSSFIENVISLKAKNITLLDTAYLQNLGSIESENISIENGSYIRGVGSFDETAIKIENGETGIIVKNNSYIENLKGYIESDSDIYLEENSNIKNLSYAQSETIQLIQANNLTLKDGSSIMGLGGRPGKIILGGTLTLENSKIIGRENNKPSGVKVNAILMSDNSLLQGFTGDIEVEGKQTFVLESSSVIDNVLGIINSCAALSMDGNETKIRFLEESSKNVKAKGIDLNNGAKIECIGDANCDYFYIYQSCDSEPSTNLEVETQSGNVPFTVEFTGGCDTGGSPVTCTIDFGDDSNPELFDTNASHVYLTAGTFSAVLTAETGEMSATSTKIIRVAEAGALPPPIGETQASLSAQNVAKGEEVNIILQCENKIVLFSIENNLGIPPVTIPPEECPAILGPFKIPETTEPGNYNFTISGLTENGTGFEQQLNLVVGESPLIPGLPFDLGDSTIFIIAGFVGIIAVIIVLVVLVKKKKGGPKKPKEKKDKKSGEISDKEMAAAEKELSQDQQQTQTEGEKPPWMVEETNGNEKAAVKTVATKPEEKKETKQEIKQKETKQEVKQKETKQETSSDKKIPLWMKKPGKKTVQAESSKEKPAKKKAGLFGFLKREKKPVVEKKPERIQKPMKMQAPAEKKVTAQKPVGKKPGLLGFLKREKKPAIEEKSIEQAKPVEATQPAKTVQPTKTIKSSKDIESLEKEIEMLKAEKAPVEENETIEETPSIPEEKQVEEKPIVPEEKPIIPEVRPIGVVKPSSETPVIEEKMTAEIKPKTVQARPKDSSKRFENLVELVKGTGGNVNENPVEKKKAVEIEKTVEVKKPVVERKTKFAPEKQVVEKVKGAEKQETEAWFKKKKKPAKEEEEQSDVPQWLKKN